ncbi:hypothetical protein GPECTOR_94g655 [Gonium pectorale]|uniref:Thymocyte nuclear protein 1 n=1 Tax=Gonium pectorale TaxID=33097 RepID=A0A150G0C2_GONPE|nr:hypothetical protein GPECTOR_94g655 [Gonium pectorale]|eukprot:KXZ43333.1 hypothetical protein GPECTOR_94g655 [Gonium pectorale]
MAPRGGAKSKAKAADDGVAQTTEGSKAAAAARPAKRAKKADGRAEAAQPAPSDSDDGTAAAAAVASAPAGGERALGGSGPKAEDGTAAGSRGRAKGKGAGKAAAGEGSAAVGPAGGEAGPRYFLMKSEPEEFSLDDLSAKPNSTSCWEGVRNAQARNIMRSMKLGDQAFFYHSSCKVPAVVGLVEVVREAYPDHTAFDKSSKYYDPRSTPDAPKWWMVDVRLVRRAVRPVTLAELRAEGARAGSPVASMVLINKSRLSVQPVTPEQWERVLQLEAEQAGATGGEGAAGAEENGKAKAKGKGKGKAKEAAENGGAKKGIEKSRAEDEQEAEADEAEDGEAEAKVVATGAKGRAKRAKRAS